MLGSELLDRKRVQKRRKSSGFLCIRIKYSKTTKCRSWSKIRLYCLRILCCRNAYYCTRMYLTTHSWGCHVQSPKSTKTAVIVNPCGVGRRIQSSQGFDVTPFTRLGTSTTKFVGCVSAGTGYIGVLARDPFVRERDVPFFRGVEMTSRNLCSTHLCGRDILRLARDHGLIPNPVRDHGINPAGNVPRNPLLHCISIEIRISFRLQLRGR